MLSFSPHSRRFVVSLVLACSIVAAVLYGSVTQAEFDPATFFAPSVTATKSDAIIADGGNGKVDPGETIGYTVQINNTGVSPADDALNVSFNDTIDPNTTLVGGTVSSSAVASNDTFPTTILGNVSISSGAFSVLSNDYLGSNPAATIASFSALSAQGGNVTMNLGTGTFTYDPPAGYEGTDTFTYVLTDNVNATSAAANRTGTVTLTVAGMVWFVNNTAPACTVAGCGRFSNPFSTLAAFQALNNGAGNNPAANDSIFVYESAAAYTGGVTLLTGQKLIGQDSTSSLSTVSGLTPPSGSPAFPTMNVGAPSTLIENAGGNGVTLATTNTLNGFTAGNASGTAIAGVGAPGGPIGTLNVEFVIVNTNGRALNLSSGTAGTVSFTSITSTGGVNNVILTGLNGTWDLGSGALSGATGSSFQAGAGTGILNYSGTITSGTGRSVDIQSKNGGSVNFSGLVTDTDQGINLQNNTGATINFTGGISASTGTFAAFTATGGGTVNATQNNTTIVNTLTTTTGTALNVANTTIGASGITFRSIAANGATNGVVLNNTGSSGGLTVTGDVGATNNSSGGTIQNTTGHGIALTSTRDVSLDQMNINATGGSGISGVTTTNFTFTNGTVNNSGDAVTESNIAFNGNGSLLGNNIAGTLTITGSTLTNAFDGGIEVQSSDGTISDATITGNTITSSTSTATSKGSGIKFALVGSASTVANLTRATISNNTISNFPSDAGIEVKGGNTNAAGTGGNYGTPGNPTNIIAITNNAIAGQSAVNKMGTDFIDIGLSGGNSGSRSVGNFNISNNGTLAVPMAHCAGIGIGFGNTGFATMEMVINNNFLTPNNTVGSSGIGGGNGIVINNTETPDLTLTVTNNNVSLVDGNGILIVGRGVSGTLKTGIRNNVVSAPLGGVRPGIRVDAGSATSVDDAVCADISANTSGGSGGTAGIGVRKQGTVATTNDFGIEGLPSGTCFSTENFIGLLNPGSVVGGPTGCQATSRTIVISGDNYVSCSTAPVPPPESEEMRFQEVVLGPYFVLERPL
ncbi:MAG: Ig-like domain-containing protein, partial [Pyrinomonadaceae bacterium]